MIEEQLRDLMKIKYGSVKAFAIQNDIPYSTVRSILERGVLKSNADNIFKICAALHIRPEELAEGLNFSEPSQGILSIYNQLEPQRQEKVVKFAQEQLDEQEQEESDLFEVTGISYAAAASGLGRGFDADDYDTYTVYTDEEPPRYDYAIGVRGDSMLPTYEAGDMLYIVDKGMSNYSGQLCIVAYNGQTYFKKVYTEPNGLRLVSLNKKYDDIFIEYPPAEDTYIKIYDVVGSFVPVEV